MAGLPKQYAKMGFKRGWKAFKAARKTRRKSGGGTKRQARRAGLPVMRRTKSGGTKVAKKRGRRRAAVVAKARSAGRRIKRGAAAVISSKPAEMMGGLAIMTTGAVASSAIINRAPMVRDMNPYTKSAIQFGAGLGTAMMFRRSRLAKQAGGGMMVAAVMGAAQKAFGFSPLAGNRLSDAELQRLIQGLGAPVSNYAGARALESGGNMGRPVQYSGLGGSHVSSGWGGNHW